MQSSGITTLWAKMQISAFKKPLSYFLADIFRFATVLVEPFAEGNYYSNLFFSRLMRVTLFVQ
jgi:hypothetical protein